MATLYFAELEEIRKRINKEYFEPGLDSFTVLQEVKDQLRKSPFPMDVSYHNGQATLTLCGNSITYTENEHGCANVLSFINQIISTTLAPLNEVYQRLDKLYDLAEACAFPPLTYDLTQDKKTLYVDGVALKLVSDTKYSTPVISCIYTANEIIDNYKRTYAWDLAASAAIVAKQAGLPVSINDRGLTYRNTFYPRSMLIQQPGITMANFLIRDVNIHKQKQQEIPSEARTIPNDPIIKLETKSGSTYYLDLEKETLTGPKLREDQSYTFHRQDVKDPVVGERYVLPLTVYKNGKAIETAIRTSTVLKASTMSREAFKQEPTHPIIRLETKTGSVYYYNKETNELSGGKMKNPALVSKIDDLGVLQSFIKAELPVVIYLKDGTMLRTSPLQDVRPISKAAYEHEIQSVLALLEPSRETMQELNETIHNITENLHFQMGYSYSMRQLPDGQMYRTDVYSLNGQEITIEPNELSMQEGIKKLNQEKTKISNGLNMLYNCIDQNDRGGVPCNVDFMEQPTGKQILKIDTPTVKVRITLDETLTSDRLQDAVVAINNSYLASRNIITANEMGNRDGVAISRID